MLKVVDLVKQLPEGEHTALANALDAGLHDARLACQCLTNPGPQAKTVPQLLAYISRAIRELEAARVVVVRHSA